MAYAVVYHMEGWTPSQLKLMQKHHRREGRDTEHCDPRRFEMNEVIHGNRDTWADEFIADVERIKELNLDNEVATLNRRGRRKEAARRRKKGHQDPWKASGTLGPVRSIVLTANAEWFRQSGYEEFEGADFRDPKKVEAFKHAAVAYLDKEIGREHCLFMVYETDEKAPHIHAYYARWNEKDTKTRGRQRMLQPTDMKHFRSAEKAQDSVAEWFSHMGLVRGAKTAEARRRARREGKMPPDKKRHMAPWQWRQAERLTLIDAVDQARIERTKADARIEAAEAAEERARRMRSDALAEIERKREEAKRVRVEEGKRIRAQVKKEAAERRAREDKERVEMHKEEDRQRAERERAVADRETEVNRKAGLLNRALREWSALEDQVKAAARKVGLTDHPLVQTAGRAIARMKELVGTLGGDQQQR